MKHKLFLGTFLVLVFVAAVQARVLETMYNTPPEWAGQDRTTFNAWDFTNVGLSLGETLVPEITDGTGTLSFAGDGSLYEYIDGFNGVVEYPEQLTISIDNFPEPLPEKRIWLQLNWAAADLTQPEDIFSIMVFSNSVVNSITYLSTEVEGEGPDSGMVWNHSVIEIVLFPNPEWEDIVIDFESPILLDSVLVHTICWVPEPGTLMLIGFGSLMLRLRRK